MISKVEYCNFERDGDPGLNIVFTYDEEYSDAYEVWGELNVAKIFSCVAQLPTPECLLVELRRMVGLTIH